MLAQCLLNGQFSMKTSRDSNGKPDLSAGNAIGISKKEQILALDCTGGQCYFNTLEVFDREQSRILSFEHKKSAVVPWNIFPPLH